MGTLYLVQMISFVSTLMALFLLTMIPHFSSTNMVRTRLLITLRWWHCNYNLLQWFPTQSHILPKKWNFHAWPWVSSSLA